MMESNLTLSNVAFLFSIMLIGGLIPSVSSLAVLSRSAASGFIHGVFTGMGIVLGDITFILVVILGLSVLAETMGSLFELIMFLGAAYLIWLGTILWQVESKTIEVERLEKMSLMSSFLAGLFITLADQKAILFYFGFFPALFDLSKITLIDCSIIIVVTLLTLGSAKLCYAFIGGRTNLRIKNVKAILLINKLAGVVMIVVGSYIMLTT